MSKKINVKHATLKIPTGYIGHIGKYVPGKICLEQLPVEVIICDEITGDEFTCHLISILPFSDSIPSILYCHAECNSTINESELLLRNKVFTVQQLAYYLYEHKT